MVSISESSPGFEEGHAAAKWLPTDADRIYDVPFQILRHGVLYDSAIRSRKLPSAPKGVAPVTLLQMRDFPQNLVARLLSLTLAPVAQCSAVCGSGPFCIRDNWRNRALPAICPRARAVPVQILFKHGFHPKNRSVLRRQPGLKRPPSAEALSQQVLQRRGFGQRHGNSILPIPDRKVFAPPSPGLGLTLISIPFMKSVCKNYGNG